MTSLAGVGYQSESNAKRPASYELVGFYDSSKHFDPTVTALGAQGTGRDQGTGLAGFFLTGQQMAWKSSSAQGPSITLFGAAGGSPTPAAPVRTEIVIGTMLSSYLAHHSGDNVAFKAHWSKLSQSEESFLADQSAKAGGSGLRPRNPKMVLDIDSHFRLPNSFAADPVVQYVVNPNNFYNPTSKVIPRDGWVIGLSLIVSVDTMIGLKAAVR